MLKKTERTHKRLINALAKITTFIVNAIVNSYSFFIGMAGIAAITYGAWLIYKPAAYLVGGFLLLIHSYLTAKSIANSKGDK